MKIVKIIGTQEGSDTAIVEIFTSTSEEEINNKLDEASRYYPELNFTVVEEGKHQ